MELIKLNKKPEEPHWESRAERRARKRLERKQRPSEKRFSGRRVWVVVVVVIVAGAWWYIPNMSKDTKPAAEDNKRQENHKKLVASCTTDAATTYHIHPHLRIIINGQEQGLPTNIGVDPQCLHPVHTHDNTGIIHVESPKKEDFTLADFFFIWKKVYSLTGILDQTVTTGSQLKLFVNGQAVTTGPDTVMQDKTSYVIMYGPVDQVLEPPANYSFPDNL